MGWDKDEVSTGKDMEKNDQILCYPDIRLKEMRIKRVTSFCTGGDPLTNANRIHV